VQRHVARPHLHLQSVFGEAASSSTSQEIPCILWNPKVHYSVHNSPLLDPIMSQTKPAHSLTPLSLVYY